MVNTQKLKRGLSLIATLALLVPSAAFAVSPTATATGKATAATRLAEAKLKVCQNKEAAISKRSTQLTKMATNMMEKFDTIAQRVKTYYTTKAVPAGKTVSTYNALVTEITTKKTAVQSALTTAQISADAFSCSSDDPKDQLTTYRINMQAVKKALQEYRTAIKNLIVAVRSVTGSTSASSSPKATTSPKVSPSPSPSATTEVE